MITLPAQIKLLSLFVIGGMALGCASSEPSIGDQFTAFTPLFADNRVYYAKEADVTSTQVLEPLGAALSVGEEAIPRNSPLSIIMRSVEIPAAVESSADGSLKDGIIHKSADYAVLLDVGTNVDGSSQSIVVWYQRGVQPDQSLNFSNLLVYYEARWDERVAPFFRVRVMDVTEERNAETRRSLERAQNVTASFGAMATNPMVSPLIGIAYTAADLILANRKNRMILDYSVQLYSSAAVAQAGSGGLGMLKRGSYIVVGRPAGESRSFWRKGFKYDSITHALNSGTERVNVPTASITIGTFESTVPANVMARSAALTTLLAANGTKSTVEQIDDASERLGASVEAFTIGERINRYRSYRDVDIALKKLQDTEFLERIGADDQFFLLRAISHCFGFTTVFTSIEEAEQYRMANKRQKCEPK